MKWVNILIPCYNTKQNYVKECIDSIEKQEGEFGMHIIWIEDGSTSENKLFSEQCLQQLSQRRPYTTFTFIIHQKNEGIVRCLNDGLKLCRYELIFRMDSDDIMLPLRIKKQLEYMENHPECMLLGTNMKLFWMNENAYGNPSSYPEVYTWKQFKNEKPYYIMNHPTVCFRKKAIDKIGEYDEGIYQFSTMEDYELELRFLKTYGAIYTIPDVLLVYRIHQQQIGNITRNMNKDTLRKQLFENILY